MSKNICMETYIISPYSFEEYINIFPVWLMEGHFATQHGKHAYTRTPHISLRGILGLGDHLGRHLLRCAQYFIKLLLLLFDPEPQVYDAYFNIIVL